MTNCTFIWPEKNKCIESFPKIKIKKKNNETINEQVSKLIKERNDLVRNLETENECEKSNYNYDKEGQLNEHMKNEPQLKYTFFFL